MRAANCVPETASVGTGSLDAPTLNPEPFPTPNS
jgi:hypothetical protein